MTPRLYLPVLIGLILAAACCPARAETIPVTIKGLGFSPPQIHAKAGDTIEWKNEDFVAHTATAQNGAFDVTIPPHKSTKQVMEKAGNFDFYCRFHPTMHGTVTVDPK